MAGAASAPRSVYSDLSDKACKITFESDEGDRVDQECPGVLGYTLWKNRDDDRDTLTLVKDGKEQTLNFYGHVTEQLNYLGDKAEWRVRDGKPMALIVRMYFSNPETSKKEQRLIVAKVGPGESCVTQIINASKVPNANAVAQRVADHAAVQACLWKTQIFCGVREGTAGNAFLTDAHGNVTITLATQGSGSTLLDEADEFVGAQSGLAHESGTQNGLRYCVAAEIGPQNTPVKILEARYAKRP